MQAVRNELDLNCMSVPRKYRKMGDFHKYYSGAARAPVLTIVVGGNHEASNYFFELYHGGWLAPNIYYLGAAGVVRYGPWRIAGLSGIYHADDYGRPHCERLPYDRDDIRSVYHVRDYDVRRLLLLQEQSVDIALSHDWPAWVELFGDHQTLYAKKPHFLASALADRLGSKPATELLNHLRPSYWFSGHMHATFSATVELKPGETSMEDALKTRADVPQKLRDILSRPPFSSVPSKAKEKNTLSPGSSTTSSSTTTTTTKTEFLGLHKVGSQPHLWLHVTTLPPRTHHTLNLNNSPDAPHMQKDPNGKYHLCYDPEWLAITKACAPALRIADPHTLIVAPPPSTTTTTTTNNKSKGKEDTITTLSSPAALEKQKTWVKENIVDKGRLRIPLDFVRYAPVYEHDDDDEPGSAGNGNGDGDGDYGHSQLLPVEFPNGQTERFCGMLGIANLFISLSGEEGGRREEEGSWVEFGED